MTNTNGYQNGSGHQGNSATNGLMRRLKRVVVTGLGAITPIGLNTNDVWDSIINGRSGIGKITRFDASSMRTQIAAEVHDFDPRKYMDRKEARRTDPFIQYAIAASQEAISDSGINLESIEPVRAGVLIASGLGGVHTTIENDEVIAKKGLTRVSPFMIPNMLVDSAAGKVAIEHDLRGPNFSVVSACASGSAGVGEAFEVIRRDDADIMLVGGADSIFTPTIFAGFDNVNALSRNNDSPQIACRPFDANRDGFVMGEGCAMLVLESEAHALARGARIYAEVIGYGSSADAFHMVAPHEEGRGAVEAMQMALRKAATYGVAAADVDYINAHGTSTKLNDRGETHAIKQVFGEQAYSLPISSTKSMTGHLLGAAGALEALISTKVLQEGIIPPTINYETPDPECDLDYTPNEAKKADVNVILSNSFGFGGHNACVLLRKYN